jgi:hypothetical protein
VAGTVDADTKFEHANAEFVDAEVPGPALLLPPPPPPQPISRQLDNAAIKKCVLFLKIWKFMASSSADPKTFFTR